MENMNWKIGKSGKPETMEEWLEKSDELTAEYREKHGVESTEDVEDPTS